jgi:hypothetical protein
VVEDGVQELEAPGEVRFRLPATRVGGGEAAGAEHLDGEAEPVRMPVHRLSNADGGEIVPG